jgi:undecaprenyl diphosphate synthase
LNLSKVPAHLAIIMDGNGRWAELRGRGRTFGHLKGARVAKNTIEHCSRIGVRQLTLYAFSTENWLRPQEEVSFLMMLLSRHLRKERRTLIKNNIHFSVIGDIERLPAAVRSEVDTTIAATANNTGMRLTFALSYGSRQEITAAVRSICEDVKAGRITPDDVNEALIEGRLQTNGMADPDLIIRTSGEFRLSNFLLWQAAYSELYVTQTLWPDFSTQELNSAIQQYGQRERRFGRTTAQLKSPSSAPDIAEIVALTATRHATGR